MYPSEVEHALARHPKSARAAVMGVPDERMGELGWGVVRPRDPHDPPTPPELCDFLGAELPSFKRPDGLTILAEPPLAQA